VATVKEEAKRLLERLPDEASWDDLMYEIYVQKKIDMSLKAAEAGKLIPHEEVKRRLLGA
jgi:predicted transcriptional regulator